MYVFAKALSHTRIAHQHVHAQAFTSAEPQARKKGLIIEGREREMHNLKKTIVFIFLTPFNSIIKKNIE